MWPLSYDESSEGSLQQTIETDIGQIHQKKKLVRNIGQVHSINRMVRSRLDILVRTLPGSFPANSRCGLSWTPSQLIAKGLHLAGYLRSHVWPPRGKEREAGLFLPLKREASPAPSQSLSQWRIPHSQKTGSVIRPSERGHTSPISFRLLVSYLAEVSQWNLSWPPASSSSKQPALLCFWILTARESFSLCCQPFGKVLSMC